MATHESALQRIQQVIADDPNNEIAKKVQTALAKFSAQTQLAKITSIITFVSKARTLCACYLQQ